MLGFIREGVVVYSLNEEYTCLGAALAHRGQLSLRSKLQQVLPRTLPVTETTPQQIIDAVALHHKAQINYETAALGDYLL